MMTEFDPIPECWYHHLDKGQLFFVVAVDEEKELIEIQYFDGNLEELELAEWSEMALEVAEQPEDWAGPLDVGETDDLGTSVTDTPPEEWDVASKGSYGQPGVLTQSSAESEQDELAEDGSQEEPWESHYAP